MSRIRTRLPGRRWRALGLSFVFLLTCAIWNSWAADVVIFTDGFKIEGRKFKEKETIEGVSIPAAKGFDIIATGPKWIIFSSNTKQAGQILETPGGAGAVSKGYERKVFLRSRYPLPGMGTFKASGFDKDWKRTIEVQAGRPKDAPTKIEQQIALLSPTEVVIPSTTHSWLLIYQPRELGAQVIRNLLGVHPDLIESDGKPSIPKRLDIATFMKNADFLPEAKAELVQLKAAVPGAWPKDQLDRFDTLQAEIERLEVRKALTELTAAVNSGRYDAARSIIKQLGNNIKDAGDAKQFATLSAQVEIVQPQYQNTVRLLRKAIYDLGGMKPNLIAAVTGGWSIPQSRKGAGDESLQVLLEAGERVAEELHPDTASRVEFFRNLAEQAERQQKDGKPGKVQPGQLVALAVTGWLKGKNGAETNMDAAIRLWQTRQMLLDYQNEDQLNVRRLHAHQFIQKVTNKAVPFDEIAQLISLLPPPKPENLHAPDGIPVTPGPAVLPGLIRKRTGQLPESASGVEYILRLPPEYHHGRPYPVLIALNHPGVPPEQLVSLLAEEADRNGYIVAAPVWIDETKVPLQPYDYMGDQHYKVTGVLRDLLRHYRVDNDRVLPFGFGDGGNFAMDVAASHPDLFAGVATM